jgi:transposase-like protein
VVSTSSIAQESFIDPENTGNGSGPVGENTGEVARREEPVAVRFGHINARERCKILRRHLVGKESVSNLANEFQVQPSQIDTWIKLVLDLAEPAFCRHTSNQRDHHIAQLEEKLAEKNQVIVELLEEHVRLKKQLDQIPPLGLGAEFGRKRLESRDFGGLT